MRITARIAAIASLAITVAGCAGQAPSPATSGGVNAPEAAAEAPKDYRAQAAKTMKMALKDPDSVKNPEITEPFSGFVGLLRGGTATVVCVRLNAKNGFGAYTGLEETALVFRGGRAVDMIDQHPLSCAGKTYGPFPEILPTSKS